MPVHLGGHSCDMERICEIAKKYNLRIIEDCAQAHGARSFGKSIGSFGDAGCFSFQAAKVMAAGEGGIVVTNAETLYQRMVVFSNYGREPLFSRGL